MLQPIADPNALQFVFRAPLFRVQRGLRIDFTTHKASTKIVGPSKAALALTMGHCFLRAVERGEFRDFAALAQKLKTSRAWVSMRVELTFLAPRIQRAILCGSRRVPSIQELVRISRLKNWAHQLSGWNRVSKGADS